MSKKSTEDILAGLELAIREVIKPENLNVWISVRERPITKILEECDIYVNYSSSFLEELRNVNLIETASKGAGMRYRILSDRIPDIQFLARKIYDNYRARVNKDSVFDGYSTSTKQDLTPPKSFQKKEIGDNSGSVKVVVKTVANLGDIGYVLQDNVIKEVMVIGVSYDSNDRRKVVYKLETYRQESDGEIYYNIISDFPRCKFYSTIEEALRNIPIQKYIKRKTTDITK